MQEKLSKHDFIGVMDRILGDLEDQGNFELTGEEWFDLLESKFDEACIGEKDRSLVDEEEEIFVYRETNPTY